MNRKTFGWLFGAMFTAALLLRLAGLGVRLMQSQEAEQAMRLGPLMDKGLMVYDRQNPQGPGLPYLSLFLSRVAGIRNLSALNETILRLGPALFGAGFLLLLLLMAEGLGRKPVLFAALGAALSPLLVSAGRFYDPMAMLVFFVTGFLIFFWRACRRPSPGNALAAGFMAGMAIATQAASWIALAAVVAAFTAGKVVGRGKNDSDGEPAGKAQPKKRIRYWLIGSGTALLISFLFYSSFLGRPRGWLESFLFWRAGLRPGGFGAGLGSSLFGHLKTLALASYDSGRIWSEAFILILAILGGLTALRTARSKRGEPSFPAYVLLATVLWILLDSFLPLNSPWSPALFYAGIVLLAGEGAAWLWERGRDLISRTAVISFLAAGFIHLGVQAVQANFIFAVDAQNPYALAQTSKDIRRLSLRIRQLSQLLPEGKGMRLEVVTGVCGPGPLVWYLRGFPGARYHLKAEPTAAFTQAPVIISTCGPAIPAEASFGPSRIEDDYELRPGFALRLSVRQDLWERYQRRRASREARTGKD